MSKIYKAIVENGAIHIETPDLEDGTSVEIAVQASPPSKSGTLFEQLEQIKASGLPSDFSISHKPKQNAE